MATTTKFEVGNIFITIFIALTMYCCCGYVQCQAQPQPQQQHQQPQQPTPTSHAHKYQQMQYQLQQQQLQQYEYQQQLQQQQHQQQLHYQQQYPQQQQQQQQHQPEAETPLALQQTQQRLAAPQTQMLRTGASLVVGESGTSAEQLGQKEYYSSNSEMSDDTQPAARRRPGTRKRKRRPQLQLANDGNTPYWRGHVEDDTIAAAATLPSSREDIRSAAAMRKRKQPAIREPLAALEKEQKLYEMRDKQRQASSAVTLRDKSYRRPYSQAKKESQLASTAEPLTPTPGSKSSIDLKNILKNAGGLSLSEILQQKNLSLDDLLKGKQNALLVLQTTAGAPQTPTQKQSEPKVNKPVRRVPYSAGVTTAQTQMESAGNSAESTIATVAEADEAPLKSKLKIPSSLQRLKLFGSSSRATTPQIYNSDVMTKRREFFSSTTSSTTTTTTRVPVYRMKQQQRSTLKPPSLLKVSPVAVGITKEVPTSMETFNDRQQTERAEAEMEEEDGVGMQAEEEEMAQDREEEKLEDMEDDNAEELEKYLEDEDDVAETAPTVVATKEVEELGEKETTTASAVRSTAFTAAKISAAIANVTPSITTNGRRAYVTNESTKVKAPQREHTNLKSNSIEHEEIITKTLAPNRHESVDSDNLENFFEDRKSTRTQPKETATENITPRIDRFPAKSTNYYETIPDFDGVDDRTDLLELIEDRRSGNRLFKVLEQRNMTLEELIEHRKRGSSQLHLATVVQNRSRFFPGQKVVLHDNMDIVTAFENFPHFNLIDLKSVKPDDIKTDSQGSSYFTSIIDIEPTDEVYKDVSENGVRGSAYLQAQRNDKSIGFFPSWKTLALASLASTTRSASTKRNPFFLPQPQLFLENASGEVDNDFNLDNDTSSSVEQQPAPQAAAAIDDVEAIENEVARAHDLLDLELSGHGFKRSPAAAATLIKQGSLYANMPAGIRSAIVASAAIVLTSLATFMVIFVVCRWKQRRRRKTNYMKTYNAMKSKLPTIASASRRSSLHNMEEMIGGVSTVSPSPVHQLQRQSSLLFPRSSEAASKPEAGARGNALLTRGLSALGNSSGIGSRTGSTTSLALSLQSVHNISTTKLNAMDPNSPEVQEYLFDALRKSF